jgi:hypothetical protein
LSEDPVDPLLDSFGRLAREPRAPMDPIEAKELIDERELREPPPIPLSQA